MKSRDYSVTHDTPRRSGYSGFDMAQAVCDAINRKVAESIGSLGTAARDAFRAELQTLARGDVKLYGLRIVLQWYDDGISTKQRIANEAAQDAEAERKAAARKSGALVPLTLYYCVNFGGKKNHLREIHIEVESQPGVAVDAEAHALRISANWGRKILATPEAARKYYAANTPKKTLF